MHFDRTFKAEPGEVVEITPGVRRITAPNPGPMTFTGTNSYLVGTQELIVIDPGPANETHLDALQKAIGNARVTAIAITHTHRDHSPLARPLQAVTGAPIVGAGPHLFAREPKPGDAPLDEAVDDEHAPQQVLEDQASLECGDVRLRVVATPGHTMNHLCFALEGENILFSGDHVMGWSTSLIAPPDGDMTAYLESLQKLLARKDSLYLPGHGARLNDPHSYVEELFAHRMDREAAILNTLETDAIDIGTLVERLYVGLDPRLRAAAGLSVLAHLERLEMLGQARCDAGAEGYMQAIWRAGDLAFDTPD